MDYTICFIIITLCLTNGYSVLRISGIHLDNRKFISATTGASFFLGVIFLIVTIRLLSFILRDSLIALFAFFVISLLLAYSSRSHLINIFKSPRTYRAAISLILVFSVFHAALLLYWMQHSDPRDPFAVIGSLHSVRYVNLAKFILDNGYFPVTGQNTGQSTLAFVALALGAKSGYVALATFLASSIIFLCMIIFDLFNSYIKDKKLSIISTFIFITANTALSTSHVLVVDSGSPFFVSGYTDTIVGIFILLILAIAYTELSKVEKPSLAQLSFVLLMLTGTLYVAPQNTILIIGAVISLSVLKCKIKHRGIIGALAIISLLIAIPQGGMLTPPSLQTNFSIPGMMKVEVDGSPILGFKPGLMHHLQNIDKYDPSNYTDRLGRIKELVERHHFKSAIFYLEEALITSIRIMLFPIMGFFLLFIYRNKNIIKNSSGTELIGIDIIKYFGSMVFLMGFAVTFMFDMHGRKWELTRFLIPGIVFGMFGFILIAISLIQKSSHAKLKAALIIIIMTFGPVSDFSSTLRKRIKEDFRAGAFKPRYDAYRDLEVLER